MLKFRLILILTIVASTITAQSVQNIQPTAPLVTDMLFPALAAQMKGHIGDKLDTSYRNRILAQDIDRLVDPFRHRDEVSCWQSEFWGKWMTSAVLAYQYKPTPQLKSKLDLAFSELVATQSKDGYIGNYADDKHLESWDIWGRKYCMLGLLAYYDLTKEKAALMAVRNLADHLMKELSDRNEMIVKKGNHRGMAASSVLEPVCLLYSRTGDQRYLNFAEEIVRQWETPDGPMLISKSDVNVYERFPKTQNWFGWEQGQKAYEMMSCYEGLLELYRLTGKNEYRIAVEKTWENIFNNEINITGSGASVECWFGGKLLQTMPVHHYQETCVTATWIKMCQQLLRLTGDIKYADAIEQTCYNALLASMNPEGSDWAKYTPLAGQRMEGTEQCHMGLNCCVASGPRGLFTMPLSAVMHTHEGLQINFFVEGTYKLRSPANQDMELFQTTQYPEDGRIAIKLQLPEFEVMTVRLRIPSWSRQSKVWINGEAVNEVSAGNFVVIRREWKMDDIIETELDMRGRIIRMGNLPEYTAVLRGPVVLARDARLQGPAVGAIIEPIADSSGYIKLTPSNEKVNGVWLQYQAEYMPESYAEEGPKPVLTEFCDYSSAGNTYDEKSLFRVWQPQLYSPRGEEK